MAGQPKVIIVLVEGDTELHLFQKMKLSNLISVKTIIKRNLWQESIKSYAITIPNKSEVLIVFDSDEINQSVRFIENVKYLKSRGHKVHLLQQTKNFEEEIAWCCGKKVPKLISEFCPKKTSGVKDFKRDFIACSNPITKILGLGMQEAKWFSRDLHAALESVVSMKLQFSKHFRLSK
ncbi:hypothetical protein IBT49_20995 [Erwinia sp. S63]|uniref:hypothetical protein n=1 Tax=Erwinia sp. S63 TaxID=2769341 RepID=UPI00190B4C3C|nr:hypothetical protein [Erwinia sp. S63]MBK0098471.1 hypothetical protein [Erwinia sp. S63]